MANKKISELQSRTPVLADLMLVGDPSSGYAYKCTITALSTVIETAIGGNYVTLATTQTISGAKTFSNNVTLTSVQNAPTDPDKFLTLNASNVVTYRTGAEVLSDIGGQGSLTLTTTGTSGTATLVGNTLNIPNYAPDLSGYVPTSRTLTINGTTFDLSANRTWSVGTVTSVAATAGTGISISGSPITGSGTLTITNTAPDQTVVLTAGTGISVSGTYPNFTIAATSSATISGSGTTNYVSKFTSSSAIGNSSIFDNGNIAIGSTSPVSIGAYKTLLIQGGSTSNGGLIQLQNSDASTSAYWFTTNTASTLKTVTNHQLILGANNADALYIQPNGNVGVGSSNPAYKLTISNGSDVGYLDFNNQSFILGTSTGSGISLFSSSATGVMTFSTNSNERMRLTSGGNLGIGTSSPAARLHIVSVGTAGNTLPGNASTIFEQSGNNVISISGGSTDEAGFWFARGTSAYYGGVFRSNDALVFRNNDSERMRITSGGNVGIGTSSPARKLSASISPASTGEDGLYILDNLSNNVIVGRTGSSYNYIGIPASSGLIYSNTTLAIAADGNPILFSAGGLERMRITSGGNVGIGTTSPATYTGYTTLALNNATNGGALDFMSNGTLIGQIYNSSSSFLLGTQGAYPVVFVAGGSERMRITSGGNLGLGVTPSAWSVTGKVFEFGGAGGSGSLFDNGVNDTWFSSNAYYNGSNWIYKSTGTATQYYQGNGHKWYTAPSGTAGNAISFTQAMTLDASGRLGIGTTSPQGRIHISGGYTGFEYNSAGAYPAYNTYFGAIGSNFSNSGSELDIWNTVGGGFAFRKQTAASTQTALMYISAAGNVGIGTTSPSEKLEVNGSIKTAAPSGGTAQPWKLGSRVASSSLTLNTGQYIQVEINGTLYYLGTVNLP